MFPALGSDRVTRVEPSASSAVAVLDLDTSQSNEAGFSASGSAASAMTGIAPISMTSANKQANIRFFTILSSRFLAEHILPQELRKKKEASLFGPVFGINYNMLKSGFQGAIFLFSFFIPRTSPAVG